MSPPSSKGEVRIVIYMVNSRGVLVVAALWEEIGALLVISGENWKLPEAVVRRSDTAFGVPTGKNARRIGTKISTYTF